MATIKKRTFIVMSPTQVLLSSLLVGAIAGGINVLNSKYQEHNMLPVVEVDARTSQCLRVVNFENGHAFNCNDVDLVLRRYRTVISNSERANEKLPSPGLQQLPANNRPAN